MERSGRLEFGPYEYDRVNRLLWCGELIALTPKVTETLELFLDRPGEVISKEEFLRALWPGVFIDESNITQNIFVLRKTLGAAPDGKPYIQTLRGRGYRFAAAVSEVPTSEKAHDNRVSLPDERPGAAVDDSDQTTSPPGPTAPNSLAPPALDASDSESAAMPVIADRHRTLRIGAVWALVVLLCGALFAFILPEPRRLRVVGMQRLTSDGRLKNLGTFPMALVNDGARLHFIEQEGNRSVLASVPVDGGQIEIGEAPFPDAAVADYSIAQDTLLVGSVWTVQDEHPLVAQAGRDGFSEPIGDLTGHDGSWSPDGKRLAFTHGRRLFTADANGTNVHQIVVALGVLFWPRWSPDGRRIRFSENLGSNESHLWEVRASGEDLHLLFQGESSQEDVCCGSWSADGRNFFYLVGGPSFSNVWVLPSSRWPLRWMQARPYQLAANEDQWWRSPVPSADGSSLYSIVSRPRGELVTIDDQSRRPKPFLMGLSAEGVAFSPNGQEMAYTAYPEGTLWFSRSDGSHPRQLTRAPMVARFPHWSPDGKTIVYLGGTPGSTWRIYLLPVEIGISQPLIPEDSLAEGVPNWSPDGSQLTFGRLLDYGTENNPNLVVQIYDRKRQSLRTIPGSKGLWSPRWSPDGRFIAAVTQDNREVKLYDCSANRWKTVANVGVSDLVWTGDSKYLFFDTPYGTSPALYRLRVSDAKVEHWADLNGISRSGFFSPWLGVSRSDEPVLLRDTSVEEIYKLSLKPERRAASLD